MENGKRKMRRVSNRSNDVVGLAFTWAWAKIGPVLQIIKVSHYT